MYSLLLMRPARLKCIREGTEHLCLLKLNDSTLGNHRVISFQPSPAEQFIIHLAFSCMF